MGFMETLFVTGKECMMFNIRIRKLYEDCFGGKYRQKRFPMN